MDRKLGAVPLWGRGAGSPSYTISPGPRPTCMPSFILITFIRPTVWPHYTNVTDRHDIQTEQNRQWSDNIQRTVLQTVAQKLLPPLSYLRLKCTKFDCGFQTPWWSLQRFLRPLAWFKRPTSKGGTVAQRNLRSIGRGFKSYSGQRCITTLGMLFTPMPLSPSSITWYRPEKGR